MVEEAFLPKIARRIRHTRQQKNITLQELARRSKVSKGLISKIENSRTIPSLPVFLNLIASLEVSLHDFFEDILGSAPGNYLLIKKESYVKTEREGREGFSYYSVLSQPVSDCTVEVMILELAPGSRGTPTTTDGFEFKYMLSGSCSYELNGETVRLEEGDSLFFDASVPHIPSNTSESKVMMLVIYFILTKQ